VAAWQAGERPLGCVDDGKVAVYVLVTRVTRTDFAALHMKTFLAFTDQGGLLVLSHIAQPEPRTEDMEQWSPTNVSLIAVVLILCQRIQL
jgi:hypothetical protein